MIDADSNGFNANALFVGLPRISSQCMKEHGLQSYGHLFLDAVEISVTQCGYHDCDWQLSGGVMPCSAEDMLFLGMGTTALVAAGWESAILIRKSF